MGCRVTFVESSLALVCSAMKFTQTQVRCIVTEQRLGKMDFSDEFSQKREKNKELTCDQRLVCAHDWSTWGKNRPQPEKRNIGCRISED